MSDRDEWGPKIKHDGAGCPVALGVVVWRFFDGPVGTLAACVEAHGKSEHIAPVVKEEWESWDRRHSGLVAQVVAYRVRKSPGFQMVEAALNVVGEPAPIREEVPA